MSCCLDVESFISEVEKYPEIWDLNCEDHRFKNRKRNAWSEVAKVFIDDFYNMSEIEKLDLYRKLAGKWRNIRDSYVRDVKKKQGKGYIYSQNLSFLDKFYKKTIQSEKNVEADNSEINWQSDEDSKQNKLELENRLNANINSSWFSEEEMPLKMQNVKRKISNKECGIEFVEAVIPESTATCSYDVEDEDKSFFESLLPSVRQFDIDQKLEFRSQILRLIKNIRYNNKRRKFKQDTTDNDYDE